MSLFIKEGVKLKLLYQGVVFILHLAISVSSSRQKPSTYLVIRSLLLCLLRFRRLRHQRHHLWLDGLHLRLHQFHPLSDWNYCLPVQSAHCLKQRRRFERLANGRVRTLQGCFCCLKGRHISLWGCQELSKGHHRFPRYFAVIQGLLCVLLSCPAISQMILIPCAWPQLLATRAPRSTDYCLSY